jgi:hypothetical protein
MGRVHFLRLYTTFTSLIYLINIMTLIMFRDVVWYLSYYIISDLDILTRVDWDSILACLIIILIYIVVNATLIAFLSFLSARYLSHMTKNVLDCILCRSPFILSASFSVLARHSKLVFIISCWLSTNLTMRGRIQFRRARFARIFPWICEFSVLRTLC